jgi:hypothetical protein
MSARILSASFVALCLFAPPAFAQQPCLHDTNESPEQAARRKQALQAARTVNNIQANQPGAPTGVYFKHEELAASPFVQRDTQGTLKAMNFKPGEEILPGWQLTLDVTLDSYWFMIKDKTDPCGFAYISNKAGLIYFAQHLR